MPIARAAANKPDDRFKGAEHWFNHAVFSPSGSWITFLHRWKAASGGSWYTRMYVVRPDGSDLRLIWDNGMISHFDWRDDRALLAWVKADDGRNCFAIRDIETMETEVLDPEMLPTRRALLVFARPALDLERHLPGRKAAADLDAGES